MLKQIWAEVQYMFRRVSQTEAIMSEMREAEHANRFVMTYPSEWAQAIPQSAHLLREEVVAWQKTPCALTLSEH